ncbi:hypothetical protein BQ8420_24690 [Nocardiopsis sp. JB363]|nr:hypothetical protein BQ8420_24690 [Nocardiopsis sp. JB363]
MPPVTTPPDLLVLHGLRVVGFCGLERLAEATGLSHEDVESELIDLAVSGLVTRVPGPFGGWGPTEAGRAADAERVSAELDRAGARDLAADTHEAFEELNAEALDLCGAWQLRPLDGVVTANDHTDAAYDARVLEALADLELRTADVCAELALALPRFGRYRVRLARALERARAGELDQVADGTDSFHTVWSQLHEDLLATLGIPR